MEKCFVDLMELLPLYWVEYPEMVNIQKVLGYEVGKIHCILDNYFKEVFIESSSELLKNFERELGIVNDNNLTDELRREVIIAKLRGAGTTTKELIKTVASSFSGGDVDVMEKNNQYIVHIKFTGTKGIPKNMEGLKKAIKNIIPAHLGVEYSFTYSNYGEFKDKTWGYLKDNNITHLEMRTV